MTEKSGTRRHRSYEMHEMQNQNILAGLTLTCFVRDMTADAAPSDTENTEDELYGTTIVLVMCSPLRFETYSLFLNISSISA